MLQDSGTNTVKGEEALKEVGGQRQLEQVSEIVRFGESVGTRETNTKDLNRNTKRQQQEKYDFLGNEQAQKENTITSEKTNPHKITKMDTPKQKDPIRHQTNTVTSPRRLQQTSNTNEPLTFNDNPTEFFQELRPKLLPSLKYSTSQIFISNFHEFTQNFQGHLRLPLYVNVYDIEGQFLRSSMFEEEFFNCTFSLDKSINNVLKMTPPLSPKGNVSIICTWDINDLLKSDVLFFELFLKNQSGKTHNIPVKISSLNENSFSTLTPFENALSKDAILSQNFNSRFFVLENVLTSKEGDATSPKIVRFARTIDLLLYRAHDASTGLFAEITYENLVNGEEGVGDIEQLFRMVHYSSSVPFEVPVLLGNIWWFLFGLFIVC